MSCSNYVKDGKLYSQFDWHYNHDLYFHIITDKFDGIAHIPGLTDSNLDDDRISKLVKHISSGVNSSGIMVGVSMIPNDWGYEGAGEKNKSLLELPSYILENVSSVVELDVQLSSYFINMKIDEELVTSGNLIQIIVSDGTNTYVLVPPQYPSGAYSVIGTNGSTCKISNFRYWNTSTVSRSDTNFQSHGTGVERFNLMLTGDTTLEDLRFTKCYESSTRLSEFIGMGGTDKNSTDEELRAQYNIARTAYLNRSRDTGESWQSCVSCVYDSSTKSMVSLKVQENYERDYISSGSDASINGVVIEGSKTGIDYGLVDAINEPNKIYGTDNSGQQSYHSTDDFVATYQPGKTNKILYVNASNEVDFADNKTGTLNLEDGERESLSGLADSQSEANEEFVEALLNVISYDSITITWDNGSTSNYKFFK